MILSNNDSNSNNFMLYVHIMKKCELKNLIRRKVKEAVSGPAVLPTPTKPAPTRPVEPPAPSKPHPLTPTSPGIKTRPKAISHDVQTFIKVRQGVKEAIDTGGYPDFIHPDKRSSIEGEIDYIESILPDLGEEADKYLEIVTSEAYKKAVDRLSHYVGVPIGELEGKFKDLPSMMDLLMNTVRQIENIEKQSHKKLEIMAVNLVLNLKEYKFIKQLVQSGEILLDVKLASAELQNGIADDEMNKMMSNDLTVAENLNVQIYSALIGDTEGKLRRALANYMTQGDAINKFFLFNEATEELQKINKTLPQKYGLVSAVSLVLNYRLPKMSFTRNFVQFSAVGSEEIIPTGDKYTIKVRGRNFPWLIHEFVKGIGEYLSMDIANQEELDTEVLSDEMKQFLAGPGLDNRLRNLIPTDKIEYLPLVKKLFYKMPIPHIKEVLLGGGKANSIIKSLINTAEELLKNYDI